MQMIDLKHRSKLVYSPGTTPEIKHLSKSLQD